MLLDRMALLVPEWRERHVPDLGVTLVELLAFVGDYFSYYQDAVGTEAYLRTARQRISVRRHTRLIDYALHEGCNARAFVCLEVTGDPVLNIEDAFFITKHPELRFEDQPVLAANTVERLPFGSYQPFEIMRLPTRCGPLCMEHLKNVVGLIHFLVESQVSPVVSASVCLAKILWRQFSESLCESLRQFHCHATESPAAWLVEELLAELNHAVDQLGLKKLLSCVLGANGLAFGLLNRSRVIPTAKESVHFLRAVLSDFFARPDDGHIQLYEAHNEIYFYAWDQQECCLPVGSTRATLLDGGKPPKQQGTPQGKSVAASTNAAPASVNEALPSAFVAAHAPDGWRLKHLSRGDVLILEEALGPRTLEAGDADPSHRQAVRLTKVDFCIDPVTETRIVEIEWRAEDALSFPLCISSVGPEGVCAYSDRISVARGNVVVVDHGQRAAKHWLGVTNYGSPSRTCGHDDDLPVDYEPPR